MTNKFMPSRHAAAFAASALMLGACAPLGGPAALRPGDSVEAAVRLMGQPTGDHPRTDGGRRVEFARGPFGKQTYMVDLDSQGRIQAWEQVLDEPHFNDIQPGLTTQDLRFRLGRPSRVWAVHYHDQTVWSYRFETPSCVLFHVGITPAGVVEDTSYGPDPLCERKGRFGM